MISGYQGYLFLQDIVEYFKVTSVMTKPKHRLQIDTQKAIKTLAAGNNIPVVDEINSGLTFVVGWDRLLTPRKGLIVLHDSLLPAYSGWCPTVTALINGETKIGVTAFIPNENIDEGRILSQVETKIKYPCKIKDAYEILVPCYIEATWQVVKKKAFKSSRMSRTYSMWRDEDDYYINWNTEASEICRFVDAAGWPYLGAKTRYNGRKIIVKDVKKAGDPIIENESNGKTFAIEDGEPVIVCENGLIKILDAEYADTGEKVEFTHLRRRFG